MLKREKWILAPFVAIICLCIQSVNFGPIEANATQNADDSVISEYSYGAKLTDQQKEVYCALKETYIGEDGLSNGVTSAITFTPTSSFREKTDHEIAKSILSACRVFLVDHPQLFWAGEVEVGTKCYQGNPSILVSATIEFKEKYPGAATKKMIDVYNTGVKEAVEEILNSITENGSAYDYYKAAHDWVCTRAEYNDEATVDLTQKEIYKSAFSSGPVFAGDGKVVCEGYGEAFKILCVQLREQNSAYGTEELQCVSVTGVGKTSKGEEPHLWNHVKMPDGNWYAIDVTWDDQSDIKYTYFLCGTQSVGFGKSSFRENHIEDTELVYYDIATIGYGRTETHYEYFIFFVIVLLLILGSVFVFTLRRYK